ncbi:MAG: magnesium transporter [Burkholderiales bacterium]|nr:magnesium transporter [Burkholderiales bacterium]
MNALAAAAALALDRRYFADFPHEAARQLESLPAGEIAAVLASHPVSAAVRPWQRLAPDIARAVLAELEPDFGRRLLSEAAPAASAAVLAQSDAAERERLLASLDPSVARELCDLLAYPENAAGRLMDPVISPVRADHSVGETLVRLRQLKRRGLRELFVIDHDGRLTGRVEIQDLAIAEAATQLGAIVRPLLAVAKELDPREDVVAILQQQPITELPVVSAEGHFVGVIRHAALISALEQETSVDMQTMVGASRDERALSGSLFAVRKRLPWLQLNLLTAFMAASIVGVFESTIARFTALAVLMPVVAGQSGNAGQQALAVTMRGLVLREVSLRQWPRLLWKEAGAGFINGLAVALTTSLGVWIWSRSAGLVAIIASAMVISMSIACIAGAMVPIVMRRFGQDPATASSIFLTTVTDVTGFLSFLGIATLLSGMLQ